ncbi:uncharacterized protein IWZ02DRAFT_259139 [Phyllosticta citriasiana]|uniref:uncharacterized protein n=1 Tax=Phyllosticta citriasiana TaxID=595635 RepID=UPI0030FD41AB
MIQDQTSSTWFWSRGRRLPSLALSSSLSSQSTSGPSSTRSKQARRDSTLQLQVSSSNPTLSTPPTTYPPSSDASSSTDSFKTPESLPSPGPPSPASTTSSRASSSPHSQSSRQENAAASERSNAVNLNKPLPILPPPSRPPSHYGYASIVPPPPPAYTPFDPHTLLFHISFPYIYASSNDASSSSSTPRYQVSLSHTRAGRPHQLALRRLTRSESRRVAFTTTTTTTGGAAAATTTTTAIPFDIDLTLYTATYYSPRAAVPDIRGYKASTVAGQLVPSSTSSFSAAAAAAGRGWKGKGAGWELCRLTRERTDCGERDGRWEYREKEVWRRDVVFAATKRTGKERFKGVSGGCGGQGEGEGGGRRVRRKGSLAEQPSQIQRRHHGVFEWRAGTVSLSSPSPPFSTISSTQAVSSPTIMPTQLLATSGAITTTTTLSTNVPAHAATAPPTMGNLRGNGGVGDSDLQSSRRRAGTTSTTNTTPSRLAHRSSSTALALRRVASRVSLRTDNTTSNIDDSVDVDKEASSPTPWKKSERARKAQTKTTGRWLRLERPLERRALDALIMAWVVSVWMDMDGQGTGLGEEGKA